MCLILLRSLCTRRELTTCHRIPGPWYSAGSEEALGGTRDFDRGGDTNGKASVAGVGYGEVQAAENS